MTTLTFGYTSGDGSGTNSTVPAYGASVYTNDTGSTVYVNRVDLLNVYSVRTATQIYVALYSVILSTGPWQLLAVSDPLTSVSVGSNTFLFSGNPIPVGAGEQVAVYVGGTGYPLGGESIHFNGANTTSLEYITTGSDLNNPFNRRGLYNFILPATIFGSDIGPGTITNLRVPETIDEPLTGGAPNIRVPEIFDEPLSGGVPLVRIPSMFTEVLHLVLPEPYMLTNPFPGFGNSASDPSIPAAANPATSDTPGLAYSVHKIPIFNTNVDEAASGNEQANSLTEFPRWKFELTYEVLSDRVVASSALRKIMGFFLSARGRFQTWLFKDPDDYLVTGGTCGTSDGVVTQFYFCRTMGDFIEPVGQVDTANTINVYLNGVLQSPTLYTVTMPNKIVFTTAPLAGTISADFQFFFVCRFLDDEKDFEKFADKLWNLNTCEFRSVLQQ